MRSLTKEILLDEHKRVLNELAKYNDLRNELSAIESLLRIRFGWNEETKPINGALNSLPLDLGVPDDIVEPLAANDSNNFSEYSEIPYTEESEKWVDQTSGNVTIRDYKAWLSSRYPNCKINKNSISGPIKRLVKRNRLRVLKPGYGRKPSVYEVVNHKS